MKRPAVFLDRDGTIIQQVELLCSPSGVRLLSGAVQAIKTINDLGYAVVVATNQPVVARGMATPADVDAVHELIFRRLAGRGARIDAFYYCPHHPQANIKKYRMVCGCRKPAPGMIFAAAKDLGIDLKRSFLVGDSTRDVLAGNRAGVSMILVRTGHGGSDLWHYEGTPNFIAQDLRRAVKIIQREKQR